MPFVNVKITAGATAERKEALIEGITDLMGRVLDKNPSSTHVVIEEIPAESWKVRGKTVAKLRDSSAPGISKR